MSKIDTQGMGISRTKSKKPSRTTPMKVTPRRLFSPEFVKEMKILINEVLDEREGKMDYDSYFDVEKFRYEVK
tara:strand:+ start:361 stop:579 length:219 start_codon:yes stop_codon:yes gene_type:complete